MFTSCLFCDSLLYPHFRCEPPAKFDILHFCDLISQSSILQQAEFIHLENFLTHLGKENEEQESPLLWVRKSG
jgi:hypothetical protein